MFRFVIAALILVTASCANVARSADVSRLRCGVLIVGELRDGDEKAFLDQAKVVAGDRDCITASAVIYSKGGSVAVAMAIGELIKELHWETATAELYRDRPTHPEPTEDSKRVCQYLPDESARLQAEKEKNEAANRKSYDAWKLNPPTDANGYRTPSVVLEGRTWTYDPSRREGDARCVCASACFFVWVAGTERHGAGIQVHRTYFDPTFYRKLSFEQARVAYETLTLHSKQYLGGLGVSDSLLARIFSIDSDRVEFLTKDERRSLSMAPYIGELKRAACPVAAPSGRKAEPGISPQWKHLTTEQRQKAVDEIDEVLRISKADMCWSDYQRSLREVTNKLFLSKH